MELEVYGLGFVSPEGRIVHLAAQSSLYMCCMFFLGTTAFGERYYDRGSLKSMKYTKTTP